MHPTRVARRPDGTRIRFFDSGGSGPPLMLANGLGGPMSVFRRHISLLGPKFRVITWEYRGTYGSLLGKKDVDLSVTAHAEDVLAILDVLGIERASYLGWSMGVQVGLEAYRLDESRISHLILLSGTFGLPMHGVPLPFAGLILPPLVEQAARFGWLGARVLSAASRTRATLPLLKRLQFVGQSFEAELFTEMLHELKTLDLGLYFRLLAELGRHDASATLDLVSVPTLVAAGSHDRLTPPAAAQRLASRVTGAELWIIPGASHYAAAEFPELVCRKVEDFLCRQIPLERSA